MIPSLFFASDPIAIAALEAAATHPDLQVQALITQPLKRSGRGRRFKENDLVLKAQSLGLEIHRPRTLDSDEGDQLLAHYHPELCLVMAYGQIVCQRHLDQLPQRWLNLHGSLLPRWRGAAPIERALEAGDSETGMMFMAMEAGLDTGPVFSSRKIAIQEETAGQLRQRMAGLAGLLVEEDLGAILSGGLLPQAQDATGASYAKRLKPAESWIDFRGPAALWARRSRAFDPWPGLVCMLPEQQQRLKLWSCRLGSGQGSPGEILRFDDNGLVIACDEGAIVVEELQIEGRRRVSWSDFRHGGHCRPGQILQSVVNC